LCPLFVSITVTSILTYNNRMSWTFLCSWTEFSHGKETFLPLAKMTIYRKNPRTHCMNLYIVSDFLNISIFFLIFIYDFLYFNMIYFNFISENIIRYDEMKFAQCPTKISGKWKIVFAQMSTWKKFLFAQMSYARNHSGCHRVITVHSVFQQKHIVSTVENKLISSPWPKVHVNYCHHLASVVCCLFSVNFSHFKLLLRNHWANWNQT
jgi:hypothetical protein